MKTKLILLSILYFAFNISLAQGKYLTKKGIINFEASVPSFEEVKAKSNSATAILNTENGEFASLVLMKSFRFKVALMEEHFNENYVESDTYPKAILKGQLNNFNLSAISNEGSTFKFKGNLTMHGETKAIETDVSIKNINGVLNMTSKFSVKPEDFNIKIPKIVRQKVADTVEVSVDFNLVKK